MASASVSTASKFVTSEMSPNNTLWITLDRPTALNAADKDMVQAVLQHLRDGMHAKQRPSAVVLTSTIPKAFCSGGDIKAARQAALDAPYSDVPPAGHTVNDIFQAEYSLVCTLARYPLPVVSLCQGVWMGFGVGGLAGFGSHRVVTPTTRFAMPENHIGLWPDVGFALLAAKAPGATGLCLALSGWRCDAPADLLRAGFATHLLGSDDSMQGLRDDLRQAPISSAADIEALLQKHGSADSCQSKVPEYLTLCQDTVVQPVFGPLLESGLQSADGAGLRVAIQGALDRLQEVQQAHAGQAAAEFATQLEERIRAACPVSVGVTLRHYSQVHRALRGAGGQAVSVASLVEDVMQVEYALAVRMVGAHNFIEGVRAVVVDKDRNPTWKPASLDELQDADVDKFFAPLPAGVGLKL